MVLEMWLPGAGGSGRNREKLVNGYKLSVVSQQNKINKIKKKNK